MAGAQKGRSGQKARPQTHTYLSHSLYNNIFRPTTTFQHHSTGMSANGISAARFDWLESEAQRLRAYVREFSSWADGHAEFMENHGDGKVRIEDSTLKPFVRALRQYVSTNPQPPIPFPTLPNKSAT